MKYQLEGLLATSGGMSSSVTPPSQHWSLLRDDTLEAYMIAWQQDRIEAAC